MPCSGRRAGFALLLVGCFAAAAPAAELAVSAGVFNVGKSPTRGEAGLELRLSPARLGLVPAFGLSVTEEESAWVYGGVQRPFAVSRRWRVTPGFGVALYEQGEGKNLGGTVELRSSLEVSYRYAERSRIGAAVYHLSNAGLYDLNPGSNSAVVVLTLPFP